MYNTGTLNFKPGRGQCPEARRTSDHVFARREGMKVFLEGVPRKRGSGGGMTVSAAADKALTGSGPQSLFGSFLVTQKGTRAAGRNLHII